MARLLHCFVTAVVSVGIAGAARVSSAQDEATEQFIQRVDEAALFYPPLAVNARFEWSCSAATPGFLIAALPPLPDELQYRFVGVDLVLVDVPARLIVDIMPLAIAIN